MISQLFISDQDINEEDNYGFTAINSCQSLDIVKYLHANGATNLSKGLQGAATQGKLDTLKYLLDNQADINTRFIDGESVLIGAFMSGSEEITDFVLERGADINAKNGEGVTALHKAAQFGLLKMVKYLIEKNAKINERENQGQTPLHFASKSLG